MKIVWIISAGIDSKDRGFFDCITSENEVNTREWGVFDTLII